MTQVILPSRRRANRGNQFKATVIIRDVIKFFRDKYGKPSKTGFTDKVLRAVINEYNAYLAEQLIKGEKIILPYNLGCLEVVKQKQKFIMEDGKLKTKLFMVDWPKTWEYWKSNPKAAEEKKLLYHANEHTDNYRYKFAWDKYAVKDKKIRMYSFHPSRLLSRKLSEHLLNPESIKNYADKC